MKSEHYQRIATFMRFAGQDTPEKAALPSAEILKLRAKLIYEEAMETIHALGFSVKHTENGEEFIQDKEPDLVEIADGCADISVVTVGTLIACGIDDVELLEMVDKNNLDKFGPGHHIREDGKLVKPPGHQPPDIAKILKLNGLDS